MNTDALFTQLEPPPGGAERFERRLDEAAAEQPSSRARVLALAAASRGRCHRDGDPLAAAAGYGIANRARGYEPPAVDVYNAPELDRLLGRSALPAELMVTVNMQAANVTEIETTNEKVRIYQIN